MENKHKYSFLQLKQIIDHTPEVFPAEQRQKMKERLKKLKNTPMLTQQELNQALIDFGRLTWPYRKAYYDIFKKYGTKKENQCLKETLGSKLASKYQQYIDYKKNRQDRIKEAYLKYTQQHEKKDKAKEFLAHKEYLTIEQTAIDCNKIARLEIHEMIKSDSKIQAEYNRLLEDYQKRQQEIENKINQLKSMAEQVEPLADEIKKDIIYFRQGFTIMYPDPSLTEIENKIRYYKDETKRRGFVFM